MEQLKAQAQELDELESLKAKISISKVEAETVNTDINTNPLTKTRLLSEAEPHWTVRVPRSTMMILRMMKTSLTMTWMRMMMMSHKTLGKTHSISQMSHRTQRIQMEIWVVWQVVVEYSNMLVQGLLSRHRTYKVVEQVWIETICKPAVVLVELQVAAMVTSLMVACLTKFSKIVSHSNNMVLVLQVTQESTTLELSED